jgi:hypothetical protein
MSVPGFTIQDLYTGRHAAPVAVTLGASPATFQAPSRGSLNIGGATISAVTLTRQSQTGGSPIVTTLAANSAPFIPLSNGDVLTITYSVAPTTCVFIPN